MDQILIYMCYDSMDYVNYFSLVINGEKICEGIPEEEISELFVKCDEQNVSKTDSKWCIVQDEDALSWNYEEEITSKGYKINPMLVSENKLLEDMMLFFGRNFSLEQDTTKKIIKIIYPKTLENEELSLEKKNDDIEQLSSNRGKTELAKIILKKYEGVE